MSESVWIECPHCEGRLKLKNRNVVGKKVPCPKCSVPFRIEVPPESEAELEVFEDDFDSLDHDDEYASNEAMPVDDDLDEFDDDDQQYERPSRSSGGRSRQKESSESSGPVLAAAIGGGGLLVVGLAVGVYFLTRRDPIERPHAVVVAQVDAQSAEADQQSDVDPAPTDASPAQTAAVENPTTNAPAQAVAESQPSQEPTPQAAVNPAPQPSEVKLTEAQLEAIRKNMQANPGALKQAAKEKQRQLYETNKPTPFDQRPPRQPVVAAQDAEPANTVRHVAATAEETAQNETGVPAATTVPESTVATAPTNATPQPNDAGSQTVAVEEPPEDPIKVATTAIRELGGRVSTGADRVANSVTLAKNEDLTDEDLQHLKAFPKLEKLDLSYSPITDDGLVHLVGLKQLTGLDLSGTEITNEGLQHLSGLKNLKALGLRETNVSSRGIDPLLELDNLETLLIGGSRIKGAGIKKLTKALPNCTVER